MLQGSPVDQNTEPNGDIMNSFLSNMSSLFPAGQTTNDYINIILKLIHEVRLPCTVYSVVPWEFNCTRAE
ncbi:hypothetical protein ACS0PU_003229 [Formica fusca]